MLEGSKHDGPKLLILPADVETIRILQSVGLSYAFPLVMVTSLLFSGSGRVGLSFFGSGSGWPECTVSGHIEDQLA